MSARRSLRGPLAALAALALLVFCNTPLPECMEADAASFDVAGSCGPDGVVSLSYEGATQGACQGNGCYAFLRAPGANAVGLPEQGEADGKLDVTPHPGSALRYGKFALVGPAPLAGTSPPAAVHRRCSGKAVHGTGSPPTLVTVTCEGDAPGAACAATLTFRGAP